MLAKSASANGCCGAAWRSPRTSATGLSVAAVIESAEVSRGGFYSQFEGADDCFEQAIEGCAESLAKKVEEAVREVGEERALDAVLGALFRFAAEDQPAARALFIESLAAGSRCLEVRESLCGRCAGLVEEGAWGAAERDPRSLTSPPRC